jgi:hypothetical protein
VQVQFRHAVNADETTVSLVYPLTNVGSAQMRGDAETEPADGDSSNQNSLSEAMEDLVFSAANAPVSWRNNPAFSLIAPWQFAQPAEFLDPANWKVTALVATAYTAAGQDALFVWTDLAPDVRAGDFNGDGVVNGDDLVLFDAFLAAADGCITLDADGVVNGRVELLDFGRNFSVFDVNYDGVVDSADRPVLLPACADFDADADVDLADFARLQSCFNGPNRPARQPDCSGADLDADGDVDLADFGLFQGCFNGPNRTPKCSR